MNDATRSREYGHIYWEARNADGSLACSGTTTTFHPHDEMHVMWAALELERAVRRGVRVPPHAVGALIVMAPDAPLFEVVRRWKAACRGALAARKHWQIWLANTRKVTRIDDGIEGPHYEGGPWAAGAIVMWALGIAGAALALFCFFFTAGAVLHWLGVA